GEYSDYPVGPCPLEVQTAATTQCSLTGRRLASLPRFAITAGLDYARPVGAGQIFAHVDAASRSGFNGDPSLSRFTYILGYNLTNANIGYRFADGTELIVFARNLLDADYIQNLTIQAGNSGLIVGTPSDPRTQYHSRQCLIRCCCCKSCPAFGITSAHTGEIDHTIIVVNSVF
ncbi:MAG: TonB-dependent receptor, partial [Sphingobacteriales bacterium]